jgi:hypothetical protein
MRPLIVTAVAAALTLSATMMPAAAADPTALVLNGAWEVSAANKKTKKATKKAAPKEQYLRAVPSAPPPGAKK